MIRNYKFAVDENREGKRLQEARDQLEFCLGVGQNKKLKNVLKIKNSVLNVDVWSSKFEKRTK